MVIWVSTAADLRPYGQLELAQGIPLKASFAQHQGNVIVTSPEAAGSTGPYWRAGCGWDTKGTTFR